MANLAMLTLLPILPCEAWVPVFSCFHSGLIIHMSTPRLVGQAPVLQVTWALQVKGTQLKILHGLGGFLV